MTTITDIVLGFASDTTGGWVYLQTDGSRHSAASDVILHMLMVASAGDQRCRFDALNDRSKSEDFTVFFWPGGGPSIAHVTGGRIWVLPVKVTSTLYS
jgi:hypothetical protein